MSKHEGKPRWRGTAPLVRHVLTENMVAMANGANANLQPLRKKTKTKPDYKRHGHRRTDKPGGGRAHAVRPQRQWTPTAESGVDVASGERHTSGAPWIKLP